MIKEEIRYINFDGDSLPLALMPDQNLLASSSGAHLEVSSPEI
jgi:hypothetical protein